MYFLPKNYMKLEKDINSKIFNDAAAVRDSFMSLRGNGSTIVTTNGCFDLLHRGHITYLWQAAQFGDFLIVGLNSDLSVKSLKGESRPIQNEEDRLYILAALSCIDAVFLFHEPDPRAFIETIQPDVHVKGGDYSGRIIEQDTVEKYGGRVHLVSFVQNRSTSAIIDKMK